jgi:hypothetical protein
MNKQNFSRFLAVIITISPFLGSCRFGNHSEQAKPLNQSNYKSVEMFFTEPKTLQTRVYLNSLSGPSSQVNTVAAPLSAIPSSILNTFTDPHYFATMKDPTKSPLFIGINQNSYIDTTMDADGNIGSEYLSGVVQFWRNPDCLTQVQILQEGTFDRSHPGSVVFSDGSQATVSGRLNLDFSYSRIIAGDCSADLTELANCYINGSGCSTDQLNAAHNLFDLYVKQSGAMKIEDAVKLKALEYVVHFE